MKLIPNIFLGNYPFGIWQQATSRAQQLRGTEPACLYRILRHALIIIAIITSSSCANNSSAIDPSFKPNSPVYGLDISKHQSHLVNDLVVKDDLSFIICKATDGIDYLDPDFSFNWKEIKRRKLVRGAYHFYRFDDDSIAQAKFFLSKIKDTDYGDLPPIVDIEDGSIKEKANPKEVQQKLLQYLKFIESSDSRTPIIYTNLKFANKYLNNSAFAKYHLWLAEYSGNTQPQIPSAWKNVGYKIWQKNDSYSIRSKLSDFDIYNGNRAKFLNELTKIK